MISKEKLKDYSKTRNLQNIGFAEKDYFQTIVLFILSQHYGKELVFKGGTALSKCYGMDRFSADLDFNCESNLNIDAIKKGLKRFNLEFEIEETQSKNSETIILWIKGPLYIGTKNSFCRIELNISSREKTKIKPKIKTLGRFLEEIPSFDVFVMDEKEILAEKIRTIMTRDKARDLYDLFFLFEKNIKSNKELINEKLKLYDLVWDRKEFVESLKSKKEIWESELKQLIRRVPNFEKTLKLIKNNINEIK